MKLTRLPGFVALLALAMLLAVVSGLPSPVPASRSGIEDRPFGYVIGDIVEQRVRLQAAGKRFVSAELPRAGRVGISLWRRDVHEEVDASGQPWLVLRYQIINAPPALTIWELPALQLKSADPAITLWVPASPFSVAPFTPRQPFDRGNLPTLRADRGPEQIALGPLERRMKFAAGALVGCLLLWGGYAVWQRLIHDRDLPFSRAVRDMRRLPDQSPQAWRRLQHALNEAAGHVVRANTLDKLIEQAPNLAQERAALERFCQESSALFFGRGLPADAASAHALGVRLRRIERRLGS